MKFKYIKFNLILSVLIVVATIIAMFSGVGQAYAATSNYTEVLDDLRKDSNFNIAEYLAVNNDYSLQVIQVAESTDGELFVYVYQPSARAKVLIATSVNMSLSETDAESNLYKLTYLNGAGVFQKYRVDGVKVSSEFKRYYNITSIYRVFNSIVDGTNSNKVDEIAFKVAQLWIVETDESGAVKYSTTKTDVVTITETYNSFIRYRSGYWFLWGDATDGHYVAFSTYYDIEHLFEAEIYFEQNLVGHHYAGMSGRHSYNRSKYESKTVKLSDIDRGHVKITGLGGTKHSWERIQRVDDFIKNESDIPSESQNKLENKQWILRFTETEYTKAVQDMSGTYDEVYTEVTNVTILRLYFETNGTVYNLGVVSDKVSEDNPYKGNKGAESLLDKILKIIKAVVRWLANLLHIPDWLGTAIMWTAIVLVVLLVVSVVVKIIHNIRGK